MIPSSAEEINKLIELERKHHYIRTYPKNLIITGNDYRKLEPCCEIVSEDIPGKPMAKLNGKGQVIENSFFQLTDKIEKEYLGAPCKDFIIAIIKCPTLTEAREQADPVTKAAVALMLASDKL